MRVSKVSLLRLGGHVDTRVGNVSALLDSNPGSETSGVLVESNVLVVLDELKVRCARRVNKKEIAHLAVPVRLVERDPHVLLRLVVVRTEELLKSLCGLPGVVVGDLGGNVVGNVSLADTVENVRANGSKEVSVNGSKSSTGKGPLVGRVVGQDGVGVLEVGDENEPVVNPEVRENVKNEHLGDRTLVSPVAKTSHDGSDTNVGQDDVKVVTGLENDGSGVKVVGSRRVVRLSTGVHDEVGGPSENLTDEQVEADHDRRVLESLTELVLTELGKVDTEEFTLLLDGAELHSASGLGDKDFITSEMSGGGVVTAVGDSPRVVGDKEHRVDDQTDGVVDGLRRRVGLVTALVTEN